MLVVLQKLVWLRSLWVALCVALVHYHYTNAYPELAIWDGYVLVVGWVLLQLCVLEIVAIIYKSNQWKHFDDVDTMLIVVLVVAVAVFSASTALDFIPTNSVSDVYTTANVLQDYQCDAVIQIAENHAQLNLDAILTEVPPGMDKDPFYGAAEDLQKRRDVLMQSRGWATDRHANYPTTDMSAYSIRQNITLRSRTDPATYTTNSTDFVSWLNETVEATIIPTLQRQYDLHSREPYSVYAKLSMKDLFIVKYSTETPISQSFLELHTDASQLSFSIALSLREEIDPGDVSNEPVAAVGDRCFAQEGVLNADPLSAGVCSAAHRNSYSRGGTYFQRADRTVHTAKGAMLSHPSRLYHAGTPIISGSESSLSPLATALFYCVQVVRRVTAETSHSEH
jgi:hypothetical protein